MKLEIWYSRTSAAKHIDHEQLYPPLWPKKMDTPIKILFTATSAMWRQTKNQKQYQKDVQQKLTLYAIYLALKTLDEKESLKELIPLKYHEFLLFKKSAANKLLLHWSYDHQIAVMGGFTSTYRLIKVLSQY